MLQKDDGDYTQKVLSQERFFVNWNTIGHCTYVLITWKFKAKKSFTFAI